MQRSLESFWWIGNTQYNWAALISFQAPCEVFFMSVLIFYSYLPVKRGIFQGREDCRTAQRSDALIHPGNQVRIPSRYFIEVVLIARESNLLPFGDQTGTGEAHTDCMAWMTPAATRSPISDCSISLVFYLYLYGGYLNFLGPIITSTRFCVTFIYPSLLDYMNSCFFNIL